MKEAFINNVEAFPIKKGMYFGSIISVNSNINHSRWQYQGKLWEFLAFINEEQV